jgi:hypothetical protein
MKALVNTVKGAVTINSALSQSAIEPYGHKAKIYIIEIIHHEKLNQLAVEQALEQCVIETHGASGKVFE